MNTKNAVAERIIKLCNQKNIAINALANISGISPSTLYSVLNEKSQNLGIVTIKKLCDGLEISLREFFDNDIFDDIEQEIKQPSIDNKLSAKKHTTDSFLNLWCFIYISLCNYRSSPGLKRRGFLYRPSRLSDHRGSR